MGSHGGSGIDFFYLDKLNGRKIYQSLAATTQANQGNGFSMEPVMIKRDVPAQTATFTIIGRTHFAAPIQELSNKVYQVAGDVTFTPAPDASYVVKGTLGPGYSAVWIEGKSGAVMGKKIEIQGDATLNFLEK
jgi:hypothetical protein